MQKITIFVLVAAFVLVMFVAGASVIMNPTSTKQAERLEYGQDIQLDDFAFTALSSQRTAQIGNETADGVFYVVPFKVMNRAKRVDYKFSPDVAVLVDNAGNEHTPSAAARAAWFTAFQQADGCPATLAAGTECSTVLVFEVPAETQAPLLKIRFGGGLLQVADALAYGKRVIQLK